MAFSLSSISLFYLLLFHIIIINVPGKEHLLASTLASLSALDIPLILPLQKPKEIHSASSETIRTENGYCLNTALQLRLANFLMIVPGCNLSYFHANATKKKEQKR